MATLGTMLALCACTAAPKAIQLQGQGLGSTWSVKIHTTTPVDREAVQGNIQARIDEVEHHLSRWDDASSLSRINSTESEAWLTIPAGLARPLLYALHLAADTGGAYDPTVAPLVDVWGFGKAGRRYQPPTPQALSAARAKVGYTKIHVDEAMTRLRKPRGVNIDLSSTTHGYAADRVASCLDELGLHDYLVDVGSEIRASGNAPEGDAWRVAVEEPPPEVAGTDSDASAMPFARTVILRNAGIATSGNYRYYFDYDGRRYSHRIDPRTGEPISHALVSVTVIDPECMHADALATALTVLGPDEGLRYATERNIAALFILRTDEGLRERMTPQFEHYLN